MLIDWFLLAGFLSCSAAAEVVVVVREADTATLPCRDTVGDVTWSRFWQGEKVILYANRKGRDERYSTLTNNSLVIRRVRPSDGAMYLCNGKNSAYLQVTPESSSHPGLGPNPTETTAQNQTHTWGVAAAAAAVVVCAALLLLTFVTSRFYFKKAARQSDRHKTVAEAIYEEIDNNEGDKETSSSSSSSPKSAAALECVYSLVQKPSTQT